MIIKSKKNIEGLFSQELKGEKFKFHHAENVTPMMIDAQMEREFGNKGWTKDRNMRKIATVPALALYDNPDLVKDGSNKAWKKYLSGEGRCFATVDPNTI